MFRGTYRGGAAERARVLSVAGLALAIAASNLLVAGCTTTGQPALVGFGGSGQRTVAFDSIDGPPKQLFDKLVSRLGEEARAHQIATVSQESPAQYRIRGYVAAHVLGQKTTVTWVWDVFNADRERAVRFGGEVPGAPSERAWAAADDAVVAQMARDGITRLAAFLASPGEAPARQFPPRGEASPVASTTNREGSLAFLPPTRQ